MDPLYESVLQAADPRTALLVYADWLEERGDARARYIRLQLAPERDLRALRAALPTEGRPWLGPQEATGQFASNLLSGVPARWWGPALPSDPPDQPSFADFVGRPHDPALPWPHARFDGTLAWLDAPLVQPTTPWEPDREEGFRLPEAFARFVREPDLHRRLPDVFGLQLFAGAPHPFQEHDLLLPFARNARGHLVWTIRLSRQDAYAPVVVGVTDQRTGRLQLASVAAPDFASFLYRMVAERALARGEADAWPPP